MNAKLKTGHVVTYSLGSLGLTFSQNCVNTFFLVYLCAYQKLNPIVMTVAFVLAGVWDAVNDPMLATLINNGKKTKLGRYRPWIALGAVLNAVTLTALFIPVGGNVGLRYAYYIIMYVLWGMSSTVLNIPFWAMLPTIADTTEERNRASSLAKLIGGLGGFLCSTLATSFIFPNCAPIGMNKAYLILGVASAGITLVFVMLTVVFNKENYELPHEDVGLKQIFYFFKTNDQLRAYAVNFLLFTIGSTIALSQIIYIYTYSYENGTNLLSSSYSFTLFWIIACTGQGIAMFFYNWLTKKIPREKMYGASFFGCIVSFVLLFLVFFMLKPGAYLLNSVLVALSGAFLMTACGINQIGSTVMIADVADYGEYKTGKRSDSVIFSIQTFITKLAAAIAMLILGIGISVAHLPTISDVPIVDKDTGEYYGTVQLFEDDEGNYLVSDAETYEKLLHTEYGERAVLVEGSVVGEKNMTILRAFMFLIPIPLAALGYVSYKKRYWLYGEKYQKIKDEIDRNRLENAAAGGKRL